MLALSLVLCTHIAAQAPVFAGAAPREGAGAASGRAAKALLDALKKRGATEVEASPPPPAEAVSKIVDAARGRLLEGDFPHAVQRAEEAISVFESGAAFQTDAAWSSWAEAQVVRALALRRLGQDDNADSAFSALVTVLPTYEPDSGITPPKVYQRFQQVRTELLARPRVSLEVEASTTGDILVDGRPIGRSPAKVDVTPGPHFVGTGGDGQRVEVSGKTQKVKLDGVAVDFGAAQSLLEALEQPIPEKTLVRKAGDLAKDVIVAAVLPSSDGLLLLVARVTEEKLVGVVGAAIDAAARDPAGRIEQLAEASMAGRDGWLDGTGSGSPRERLFGSGSGTQKPPEGPEGEDNTWLFVGVGAGVTALVVAGVVVGFVVVNSQSPNPGGIHVLVDSSALR